MFIENIIAWFDKMFHDHGDFLIKVFSVIVALMLLGLFFLATKQFPTGNTFNEVQQGA
ncbi:MAG: hypothetical protein Q7S08_02860 [bacterium]|nr:hypothetical protein [bacterium]